jgi:DHA2 family multidrug resistance protein
MSVQKDIQNRGPITAALMLATLMNTLDSTIANVALPHIQGSVSAAQDQITWVLTSYIIGMAVMTPLSGWLSLKVGRKRMFMVSIAAFTVASGLCGVATSLPEIVLFRMIQGLAGASLMPLSQATMLDIYPQRMMQQVMAIWSAVVVMGPILGPTLGGWLTEHFTWRWVFYINLPVGILAFLGVVTFMSGEDGGRARPFDFLGFGALSVFILGFQLVLDRGPQLDWFDSWEIRLEAALSVAGLWVFVIQTMTAEHPFFHRDLAKNANFVVTAVYGIFLGVLMFATSALLPSFMQNLLGYSALQSGVATMTRGLGSLVSFICLPMMMNRWNPRLVLLSGVLISAIALWMMGKFDLSMSAGPILFAGFVQGMGTALLFSPLNTLGFRTLNGTLRTEGAIVATVLRSMGSSIGISIFQAILVRDGASAHAGLSEHITITDPVVRWSLPAIFDLRSQAGLAALNAEVTRQGMMISYDAIFSALAIVSLMLVPPLLLLRPPPRIQPPEPDLELVAE